MTYSPLRHDDDEPEPSTSAGLEDFLSERADESSASPSTLSGSARAERDGTAARAPGYAMQASPLLIEASIAGEEGMEAFSSEKEPGPAAAASPVRDLAAPAILGAASTRPRLGSRIGRREAAVLVLCLAGLAEIAWIGWAMKTPRAALAASIGEGGVAVPGSAAIGAAIGAAAVAVTIPAPLPETGGTDVVQAAGVPRNEKVNRAARDSVQPLRATGRLAVSARVPLEIFEKGRRLGSSESRLALPVGRHQLEAVNTSLGVRIPTTVTIVRGRTASIALDLEPGLVNVNALPWASVRIDDTIVGETPLANLRIPPGKHTVIFTHPALGERKTTMTVQSGRSLRVSMNLTK